MGCSQPCKGTKVQDACLRGLACHPNYRRCLHASAAVHRPPQEFYRWEGAAASARAALAARYRLLPLYYTLLQNASESGYPVLRPLFMAFPQDALTYPNSR